MLHPEKGFWDPKFPKQKNQPKYEFQELLWILQQQPVYMSRLSEILRKNSVQELELDLGWMFSNV